MIIRFLKRLLNDPTDPVKHCGVYKTEGCAHVDGFLCNLATCEILKKHNAAIDSGAPAEAKDDVLDPRDPVFKEVPDGFVLLQRHNGHACYAACMDGGLFHGWLMWKNYDGRWVSKRKLEAWEIMQVEDQRDYGIVQSTNSVRAG